MLEQYRKEISQIHAPADLIQRTKEAMKAEEERLRQSAAGNMPQLGMSDENTEHVSQYANSSGHRGYMGKFRRWTLPLTAVAAVVILVSVSTLMQSVKSDSTAGDMMNGGCEDDVTVQFSSEAQTSEGMAESEAFAGEEAVESAPEEAPDGSASTAGEFMDEMEPAANESMDMAESADAGTVRTESATDEMKYSAESMYESGAKAEEELVKASEEDNTDQSASAITDRAIAITEVEEKPSFCDNMDTERVYVRRIPFYILQEDAGFSAYVNYHGVGYLITGEMMERNEFLEEAYELLLETGE